jgi:gliding motility-associated-like protein
VVSSNNLLFVKSTERIAIQGGNGGPATLVAHEYGTDNFRAYPITEQGIGNPVVSSTGSVHDITNPNDGKGYIKFGGDSTSSLVAVALDNRVELFNYDTETRELSEPVTIDFTGQGQPYGIEIVTDSSGNTVLYVSTDNGIYGATVQRPLSEGQSISVVLVDGTAGTTYGAIQRGPDGQIYVAQPGQTNVGTLSPNPNDPSNSGFNAAALPDGLPNGAVSGFGLPTYVSFGGNSFPDPSISVDEACVGNEISFSAEGRDNVIETYSWTIERVDASGNFLYNVGIDSADAQNFTMMIDSAGTYVAKVLLSNDCEPDTTLTQNFEVTDGVETTLPESALLCQGGIDITAVEGADVSELSFAWVRRGAVGGGNLPAENTISVNEEGYYFVTVTNAEGCTSEDSIFIVDERPRVRLPGDTTLCVGDELRLDVRAPNIRETPPGYEWVILDENGATLQTSNEPTLQVDETTPDAGFYQYTVTVTDNFGCFIRDTMDITINPSVEIALTKVDPTACETDDGSITLTFPNGEDPTQYTYRWTGPAGFTSAQQSPTNIGAGVYSVTVTGLSNCPVTETIGLDDPATFSVASVTPEPDCDNSTITVDLQDAAAPGTDPALSLFPMEGRIVGNEGFVGTFDIFGDFNVTNLAPDTYTIEMTDANGCVVTTSAVIAEPEEQDFDFAQDVVTGCGEATITVNYNPASGDEWTFEWFGPNGNPIPQPPNQSSLTTSVSGTYEVRITNADGRDASGNVVCPATKDIPVFVDQSFLISLEEVEPDNSCETGEKQLTVNFNPEEVADRDLIYRWTFGDNPLPLVTRTITVTETGDYRVTVRDRNSACDAPSEPLGVFVNQPLSVALFYGNACADGSSVPLYAGVQATADSLSFRWFGPNGQALPRGSGRGDTLLIRPDFAEGQYSVEVTSFIQGRESCQATATSDFSRNPVPTSNLGLGPFIICPRDPNDSINSVTLRVDDNPLSTIQWTTPLGPGSNAPDIVADRGGTYIVEITNEFGCTIVDSVEVIEDCAPRINAPNAFRPGGVNNEFFVYHKYVSTDDFDVRIYNRWGEIVFQSDDRDFRWDGTYNGRPAPLGTYPYVVRFKGDTDTAETSASIRENRGGVTIIR